MTARITLGNLTVDRSRYMVWIDGNPVELTYVEFELLYVLARSSQRVMARETIVQAVWGEEPRDHARKLTVHVSRLRKKLRASRPYNIRTIPKRGYSLADQGHASRPPSLNNRLTRP